MKSPPHRAGCRDAVCAIAAVLLPPDRRRPATPPVGALRTVRGRARQIRRGQTSVPGLSVSFRRVPEPQRLEPAPSPPASCRLARRGPPRHRPNASGIRAAVPSHPAKGSPFYRRRCPTSAMQPVFRSPAGQRRRPSPRHRRAGWRTAATGLSSELKAADLRQRVSVARQQHQRLDPGVHWQQFLALDDARDLLGLGGAVEQA